MKNKGIQHNELDSKMKASMKSRIITGLILALVGLPCLFLGGWFYFIIVTIIVGICAYEIVHSNHPTNRFRVLVYIVSMILMYSFVFWIFIKNNLINWQADPSNFDVSKILTNSFNGIEISTILVLATALFFFVISFLDEKYSIGHVFYFFSMIVIVGICLQSFLYLRYSPFPIFDEVGTDIATSTFKYGQSSFLILYVIISVMMTDIGAYFIGVYFGKHKINPRISPKKTWEGLIGGIVISFIFSCTFAFVMAHVGMPLLPTLDLDYWYFIVILSIIMPILGTLGDFIFSSVKRHFNIKDFSNIFPGHGGMLDRLDSVLVGAACCTVFVIFINDWFLLNL